jgi:prevent-host-death family protein
MFLLCSVPPVKPASPRRGVGRVGLGPNSDYRLVETETQAMSLAKRIKPISYLKAHAPEIIRELNEGAEPLIVTVRGEAKAVVVGMAEYERQQETLALLKLLAMAEKEIAEGKTRPLDEVIAERRKRRG